MWALPKLAACRARDPCAAWRARAGRPFGAARLRCAHYCARWGSHPGRRHCPLRFCGAGGQGAPRALGGGGHPSARRPSPGRGGAFGRTGSGEQIRPVGLARESSSAGVLAPGGQGRVVHFGRLGSTVCILLRAVGSPSGEVPLSSALFGAWGGRGCLARWGGWAPQRKPPYASRGAGRNINTATRLVGGLKGGVEHPAS